MKEFAIVLSLVGAVLPAARAHADPLPDTKRASETAAETATAEVLTGAGCTDDAESLRRSYDLFSEAGAAYEAQNLARAIQSMIQAYEASSCHEFLFMLGELNAEHKDTCAARQWYARYVREVANGVNAQRARSQIASLAAHCETTPSTVASPSAAKSPTGGTASVPQEAQPPPGPTAALRAADPPAHYWTTTRVFAWSSVGAALAAGAGAAYFAVVAGNRADDYEAAWNTPQWAEHDSLEEQGKSAERAGLILGTAAGALGTTGVLLLLFGERETSAPSPDQVSLHLKPSTVRADYRIRF